MSFTIKIRGAGGPIAAEYDCPEHGRFDLTVARDDNGDPPEVVPCEHVTAMVSHRNAGDSTYYPVKCGVPSTYCISAPRVKKLWKPVAAVKGKADERPSPYHQDLSAVADGKMHMGEWQEQRNKLWEDWRRDEIKKAVG